MRVNAKKSTVMRFSPDGEWEDFSVRAGGKEFHPKKRVGDGGVLPPKYLGFVMDPALRGGKHLEYAVNKAKGSLHRINPVGVHMGEAHALKYVEANISPSVLYGTEMVREVGAAEKLDKVWEMAVAEGTLVGDANVWHSAEARIRRGAAVALPGAAMVKTAPSEAGGDGGETGQECRRAARGNCDHIAEGAGDVRVCGSVFGSRQKHSAGGRTG